MSQKECGIRLDIRNEFLLSKSGEALAQVAQGGGGVTALEVFKNHMDVALSNKVLWAISMKG